MFGARILLPTLALAGILLPQTLPAATVPNFGDLRGIYKGVGTITITNNKKRRTLSGPVKLTVRLSRNKKVLQIRVEGNLQSNAKKGKLTSYYRLSGKGGAHLSYHETITPGSLKGNGTTNLRRTGGRFTMNARGYGSRGLASGSLKLQGGRTLKLTQKYRGGANDDVEITYLAPKRGKN